TATAPSPAEAAAGPAQAPAAPQTPPAVAQQPPPAPSQQPSRAVSDTEEIITISPVRRMIAEHMVKSKFTLPHATSMIEVDMTPVVQYREARKSQWQKQQGISLSFMAFVAHATVEALAEYPLVNSEW